MSVATARAGALVAPAGALTVISSCMSPWPNLSPSSCVALADCEPGSWKPPADRLLATGIPKMAAPTITRIATATIRRGAAMANRAIRCSTSLLQFIRHNFAPGPIAGANP